MANINDILNDPWGPYTHAEVEAALKAYFTTLEQRISQASPQGGIGLTALSQEVQALLAKADTALQSESDPNVASWAKSQNKPEYNANEVRYNTLLSLKQKLDAMDAAITAASQSGGSVTVDSELGNTDNPVKNRAINAAITYLQNQINGIVSLDEGTSIDSLNEIVEFLENLRDSDTLAGILANMNTDIGSKADQSDVAAAIDDFADSRTINGKALSSNVTIGMSDIPGLLQAIANAGSGAVSVTTNQDGTFVIHVGETDYTINLNHTHEGMAKLAIVDEEPSSPALDTIYALVDNAEDPTEIESLWIAGLEFVGSGVPADTPQLKYPNITELGLEETSYGNIVGTIQVKAKNINTDVNVAISGTDFSITAVDGTALQTPITSANSPLVISDIDASLGVTLTIAYGGSMGGADGTLVVSSAASTPEFPSKTVDLFAQHLPSGYSRLEYVNNATKGFKTDIGALRSLATQDDGSKWVIEIKSDSIPSGNNQIIFGSSWDVGHYLGLNTSGKYFVASAKFEQVTYSDKSVFEIEFITYGMRITCNGETISGLSQATPPYNHVIGNTASTTIANVCVANDMNTPAGSQFVYKGRIYSVNCTFGGSFDGVPAQRLNDNKKGIYDKANDVFYPLT